MTKTVTKRKFKGIFQSWTIAGTSLLTLIYELSYVAEPALPLVQEYISHNQFVAVSLLITIALRARTL